MTREQLVVSIKQQLRMGKYPARDDIAELLRIIDALEVECQRERELSQQAWVDREAYNALFDEYLALMAAHNDVVWAFAAQPQCDRKVIMQAQRDQNAYRVLIAAHNMLTAAHSELLTALDRVGLRITQRKCDERFSWGYQWDSEDWRGGYTTLAEAVEAALRARLPWLDRQKTEAQPDLTHFVHC